MQAILSLPASVVDGGIHRYVYIYKYNMHTFFPFTFEYLFTRLIFLSKQFRFNIPVIIPIKYISIQVRYE